MTLVPVATIADLADGQLVHALVGNTDLVIAQDQSGVHAMYGRCLHRGALLADGHIDGDNLICGLHGWDYRLQTGVSAYNNAERLARFETTVEDDVVFVEEEDVTSWEREHPQAYDRDSYLGAYLDLKGAAEEPYNTVISSLAEEPLQRGAHGPVAAMGVPRTELPAWEDIQVVTAQLATPPLLDGDEVSTSTIIGPGAARPVEISLPLLVSDMSFGSLSQEAKVALARGAELAETAICSGEGGMLPEEQAENSRYFYELASGMFGFSWDRVAAAQAFHFKFGQAAKTGTGGHLPASKVTAKIGEVRGLPPGQDAISPARFKEMVTPADFRSFATEVRERTDGIPIGAKLSAQRIEADLDAALEIGVDYIILDGRGGGTGASPRILRDNISVPTIPALARARRHLDRAGMRDVTLVVTGGLRIPADFVKALALGADAIAIANSAIQAIGCQAMRACHTNNCPVGIATQKPHLRARLPVDQAAQRLANFFASAQQLMVVMARACGHSALSDFSLDDLTTFDYEMSRLAGIPYGGVRP